LEVFFQLPVLFFPENRQRLSRHEKCRYIRAFLPKMPTSYFFLNPVLAPDCGWVALEWQPGSPGETDFAGFIECFTDSTAAPLARVHPLVLPIQAEFLLRDEFIDTFENEPVIFVLPESCLVDGPVIDRCKELRAREKQLALQIGSPETLRRIPRDVFRAARFDAADVRRKLSAQDLDRIGEFGLEVIATRVDSHETFEWLTGKGVQWSDGRFLTKRNPRIGKEPDFARLELLKLLVRQDTDTRGIEAFFHDEARLSDKLLCLLNSAAIGVRAGIGNISQAIALLGRSQLRHWLQLLVYANDPEKSAAPNPLMQLAAARGRQMELLSATIDPIPDVADLPDGAFTTGLFSLLDILLKLPMSKILEELPLQDEVIDTLTDPSGNGVLARLLSAVIAGEAGNFATAARLLSGLGISPAIHTRSQVTAFYWASRINAANPRLIPGNEPKFLSL
jgi:EAL and modified HD-GYP domain-containing signal transduction protein